MNHERTPIPNRVIEFTGRQIRCAPYYAIGAIGGYIMSEGIWNGNIPKIAIGLGIDAAGAGFIYRKVLIKKAKQIVSRGTSA